MAETSASGWSTGMDEPCPCKVVRPASSLSQLGLSASYTPQGKNHDLLTAEGFAELFGGSSGALGRPRAAIAGFELTKLAEVCVALAFLAGSCPSQT